MDLQNSTGPLFQGSKSGFNWGLKCEEVALEYYLNQGFQLVQKRLRTRFAEVDLLVKKNNLFVMVEVKSAPREGFENFRVSSKQKQRLKRVFQFLNQRYTNLSFELVFVNKKCEVQLVELGEFFFKIRKN